MVHFRIVYLNSFMSSFHSDMYCLENIITIFVVFHVWQSKWQNFSNESVNNLSVCGITVQSRETNNAEAANNNDSFK